jgi:hypothetical protein
VFFLALNDLELEDPVKSPLQLPETLNQEDLVFTVFLLHAGERSVAQSSFSHSSHQVFHLTILQSIYWLKLDQDLLCSLHTRPGP